MRLSLPTASQQERRTLCCCRSSRRTWMPACSTPRRTRCWSRLFARTGRWWWWWTASSRSLGWTRHQRQETLSLTHQHSHFSPLPSVSVSSSSPPRPWPTALQLLPTRPPPACCRSPLLLPPRRRPGTPLPAFPTAAWIPLWPTRRACYSREPSCPLAPSQLPCAAHPCRPLWPTGASSTARARPRSCHSSSSPSASQLYPRSSSSSPSSRLRQPLPLCRSSRRRLSSSSSSRFPHLSVETSQRAPRLSSRAAWVATSDTYRPPSRRCRTTHPWAPERTRPRVTLWLPSCHQHRRRSRGWVCRAASAPRYPSGWTCSARCHQERCPQYARLRRLQLRRPPHHRHRPQPSTGNRLDQGEIPSWAAQKLSKTKCASLQIYDPLFPLFFPFFDKLFQFIFKNGAMTKKDESTEHFSSKTTS